MGFLSSQSRLWTPHLREATWVALGQISAAAGGLLTIKVCTNVLGPADFGQFSAALTIAGLAQVCLFAPISQSATRYFSIATKPLIYREYRASLLKLFLLGACAAIAAWLVSIYTNIDQLLAMPVFLVLLFTLASGLQSILLAVFNAARLRKVVAGLQTADAILRPALVFLITLLMLRTPSSVMVAYILASLLLAAAAAVARSASHGSADHPSADSALTHTGRSLFRKMVSFAWPFAMFGILGAVGSHGERLLLINLVSWQDIGVYSLMMQLASAPNLMLTGIINQYYLPVVFQSDPLGSKPAGRSYRLYLALSAAGICTIAVVTGALGRWIVPLFSSTDFLGHQHLLWLLVLSAGIFNMGQQLVLPGMRASRLDVYLPAKLTHSLALLLFAILLVPSLGIDGMALASLAAAVLYTAGVLIANLRLEAPLRPSTSVQPIGRPMTTNWGFVRFSRFTNWWSGRFSQGKSR